MIANNRRKPENNPHTLNIYEHNFENMKRWKEIEECKDLLREPSIDHLHIRRKAVVTGFSKDFQEEINNEFSVVAVEISEWDYDEFMTTLRWELQRELSTLKYYLSKVKSLSASVMSVGAGTSWEPGPDYSRAKKYIEEVAAKSNKGLVIFINFHGERPVDNFSWVSKLGNLPENTTLVTEGFQICEREESEEYEIGRLNEDQTVEFLLEIDEDLTEEEAKTIHHVHDGNPVAIEIALESGNLEDPLSGDNLERLWAEVYDDKLSAAEWDLLYGSSHLIDLDYRDVAMTVGKTRGECREILRSLESKGVVSRNEGSVFSTDAYVKRYFNSRVSNPERMKHNRTSFRNYAEKWIDSYESSVQDLGKPRDSLDDSQFYPDEVYVGLSNVNLYLSIYHFSEIHNNLTIAAFVDELDGIDAENSGIFAYGMIAQRFFFEEPKEIISEMAKTILGIEEEIENEIFSGTFGIFVDFDFDGYLRELSKGWSGDLDTNRLQAGNISKPDQVVETLQREYGHPLFRQLPPQVKTAISRVVILSYVDSRRARDYYNQFGKTAERYGLEEEPFCEFLNDVRRLLEITKPVSEESEEESQDMVEKGFDSLNNGIRDRIELRDHLEQNRSEAQREFQEQIERIRNRPNEIVNQYIICGDHLAETSNSLFPYLWYAFGDRIFAKVILGQKSPQIYGEYKYWTAKREDMEEALDENDLAISIDEIEATFE